MKLKREPFDSDIPELDLISPMEPFEVDGILYTPPWMRDYGEEGTVPVHYGPMFDLKEEYWADPEHFEYL